MKMCISLLLALVLMLSCACKELEYKSDEHLTINTGAAFYPNYPFKINGKVCKSVQNIPGMCMYSTRKTSSLFLTFFKRPYDYDLEFDCSSKIGFSKNFPVGANQNFVVQIPYSNFEAYKTFLCNISMYPKDGRKGSALGMLFVVVHDGVREPQENVGYVYDCKKHNANCKGKWVYLGQQSLYSSYKGNHKKKPYVKYKGKDEVLTETYNMRFNYVE